MEKNRKTRQGHVLSNKMDKTVIVEVETRRAHPRYKRIVAYRSRFKAHDAENKCDIGDVVRITASRPLSKEKRWRVVEIVKKAVAVEVKPAEIE
jgi:small subunit ribosomal protein S17